MNTDGSAINPVLIGLGGGSRKSYHQPIFTLVPSAHRFLMLLLDQATLDSTATAQASAAQGFHSHASPGAQAQASTGTQTQASTSAQASAAQDFHSHASPNAQTQASTSAQTQASTGAQALAAQDFHSHASPNTQTQAPVAAAQAEGPLTNKWPKEHTAAPPDAGFDPMMDGELTPHASPAPKRSKQGLTKGADKSKPVPASGPKPGIRKSTRKKH
jgi:hypothetical protein